MALTLKISVLFRLRDFSFDEFITFRDCLFSKLLLTTMVGGG